MPQVLAHYRTDPQLGLSASAVAEARRRHGRNELAPEPGAPACGGPLAVPAVPERQGNR